MRDSAPVVAISANELLIFGGGNKESGTLNTGYIYDVAKNETKPVLG